MKYVLSDIHGRYDLYEEMLKKISFSDSDTLYVLGDCADRGPDGIKVWLDLMERRNVVPFLGNHEDMALKVFSVLVDPDSLNDCFQYDLSLWTYNGGKVTFSAFTELEKSMQEKLYWFVGSFCLHKEIEVNGERFFLSHSIGKVNDRRLQDFDRQDYIWGRPDYGLCYDENTVLVTGHTPTALIDPEYTGRIYRENNHLAIDCGAVFRLGRLGCVCLDTMEEFYVN